MDNIDNRLESRAKRNNILKNFMYVLPALLLLICVILLRKRLGHIITPLVLSMIVYFFLEPLVYFLESRCKVKRNAAIFTVFVCTLTILTAVIIFIAPLIKENINDFINNLPDLKVKLINTASDIVTFFGFDGESFKSGLLNNKAPDENVSGYVGNSINNKLSDLSDNAAASALSGSYAHFFRSIIDVFTGVVISFYLLRDRERISEFLLQLFPYSWRAFLKSTSAEIEKISSSFIRGQLFIAFIIGSIETVGLWLLGCEYPIVFGIIGGLSNLIPYFGPFIGAVPAVLGALLVSPLKALWVALFFVAVQQIDNNFISPKIIQGQLGIHPVTTIVVVFAGGEFFGVAGFLLSIPIYAIIKCIVKRIFELFIKKNTATV